MSNEEDAAKTTLTAVEALGSVIKHAGESPEAREAASNLGKAAVTVTQAINNCLLPIAAVNYAFARAQKYFAEKFEADLREASKDIPEENLVEPAPFVAAPALQGLAFAHDEDELRRLYLSLLATSMDGRSAQTVHPAFVEVIKQLSPFEAGLARNLLSADGNRPIITIIVSTSTGFREVQRHVLGLTVDGVHVANPNVPIMVTNFMRLGLVDVDYSHWISDSTAYDWVTSRPEYIEALKMPLAEGESVDKKIGVFRRTSFGAQFAAAVGIEPVAPS